MTNCRTDSSANRLSKIPVQLSVQVCGQSLRLDQFINWTPGSVLAFEQQSSSSLQLRLGGQNIATGRVVKVGEQLGFRVESIAHPAQDS